MEIEIDFLNRLFETEPLLSMKFYRNIALKLSKCLRALPSSKNAQPPLVHKEEILFQPKRHSVGEDLNDVVIKGKKNADWVSLSKYFIFQKLKWTWIFLGFLREKFSEVFAGIYLLLSEYPVALKRSGKLYVMQNQLMFYSKVFGLKTKAYFS